MAETDRPTTIEISTDLAIDLLRLVDALGVTYFPDFMPPQVYTASIQYLGPEIVADADAWAKNDTVGLPHMQNESLFGEGVRKRVTVASSDLLEALTEAGVEVQDFT